ncbi:cobalamin biosynthesis protein [Nostoc sp. MG11]|uniref:cobalamin biosynthesis protein n=1 Tax=Nostoc sp. MG11 TaxID=2721166 RepID=UPI001865FD0D|nr:cobalamin biosynthesis protein [Nostoc sp. MG11]
MNEKLHRVQLHQQLVWVGIGCQRGTSGQLIDKAIGQIFQDNQLSQSAIAGIATINTKASEVGLLEICRLRNWTLKTFSAEILRTVSVPNPATIIDQAVGTSSVAEAAAILAASQLTPSSTFPFFASTEVLRVTCLVPKQIFRLQGQLGAVTVAVAQELDKGLSL